MTTSIAAAFKAAGPEPTSTAFAASLAGLDVSYSRRRSLGLFLRHLARGERVAQRGAQRQALLAPDARAARFLRSQARQEAMHAQVFGVAAATLGASALTLTACPYAAFDARLHAAALRRDYAETVVGTQLVLEALGEVLLERLDAGLTRHGIGLMRLRQLLRAQEAAHHAFGVAQLEALAAKTPGGAVALLQRAAPYRALAGQMLEAGAPLLRDFDLAPGDIARELDLRLAQSLRP